MASHYFHPVQGRDILPHLSTTVTKPLSKYPGRSLSKSRSRPVAFRRQPLISGLKSAHFSSPNPPLVTAQDLHPSVFPLEEAAKRYHLRFPGFYRSTGSMFLISTITHRTMDTAQPLVMLTSREGHKYLVGKVPEGTQRVINESRTKLAKLRSIFLTGIPLDWLCIGGLPGLFLTISDSTKKSIEVFSGSSLLSYVVATWRSFVFRRGVELKLTQVTSPDVISDAQINVHPILVTPSPDSTIPMVTSALKKITLHMFPMDTSKVNSENPNSYKLDHSVDDIHNHVRLPNPETLEPSTSYRITFQPVRGKFDPKAAIALGIKPGKDFRTLAEGECVANNEGVLVHPSQVVGSTKHYPEVLVVDIPSNLYLNETISKLNLIDFSKIELVYHFLGNDVPFYQDQYQQFLARFSPQCQHVVSGPDVSSENCLVFKSSAINTLKLRSLQKDYFSLPCCDQSYSPSSSKVIPLHALQRFDITVDGVTEDDLLITNKSWDQLYDEHVAPLALSGPYNKDDVIDTTPVALFNENLETKSQVQTITLGTGSALPSLYRNVISNLVRIPYNGKFRSILFDGGENTLGTIHRTFGNQTQTIFKELSMIYLSHLHADHHLGLVSIIKEWFLHNKNKSKILYLVIPWQFNRFLEEWTELEPQIDLDRIAYVSCEDFLASERPAGEYRECSIEEFEEIVDGNADPIVRSALISSNQRPKPRQQALIEQLYDDLKIRSILTCRAIHCYWAYSVTVAFDLNETETFTVSFSGDTRPNPKFVEIGQGSDLLIHESSLAEDLIEEAIAKKHSTMIEAVTTAKLMGCPKVILTHFSARFSNKADFSVDSEELVLIATNIRNYLSDNGIPMSQNILLFDHELDGDEDAPKFKDLQICYAFDLMHIRYGDISNSKLNYNDMLKMFIADERSGDKVINEEKKAREVEKMIEKRNAKRDKRMKLD